MGCDLKMKSVLDVTTILCLVSRLAHLFGIKRKLLPDDKEYSLPIERENGVGHTPGLKISRNSIVVTLRVKPHFPM